MVKVSVIASPRDNFEIDSESIEIVSSFDDASGDYVYFKNTKDNVDLESVQSFCMEACDLEIFNSKEDMDETVEKFKDSFDGFWQDILNDDFAFAVNLFGKLDWDILVRKDKLIRKSPDEMSISQAIDTYNRIFQKFIDNDMMGQYKPHIYDVKVEELLRRYENEPGEDSYDLLKADFIQMVYNWRFTEFSVNTTVLNKLFFDNVAYTKTYDDFVELMEDYYIRVDMFYLNEDIRKLRRENKRIKQKTARLSKMNSDIINSRSWKLTKPLRAMK